MNKVFLVGYLAADPKQRITNKGMEQSNFSVAVHDVRSYNETYFIDCVAWSQTAKFINSVLKKGNLVSIDGRLIKRSYVNGEGRTIYLTEVIVDVLKSLSNNSNSKQNYTSTMDTIINSSSMNENLNEPISIDDALNSIINESSEIIDETKTDTNEKLDWEEEL